MQDLDVVVKEITRVKKTVRIEIFTYSEAAEEDAETFFHAVEKLQTELSTTWTDIASKCVDPIRRHGKDA